MVPPCSDRISRVTPYSKICIFSTCTGLSPTLVALSRAFQFLYTDHWPGPRSLAATDGVSVDFLSSGYWDVSLRRVCFLYLCIQYKMTPKSRVSPFGHLRIKACSQLLVTFRSVPRPSSPLFAKAFTRCTFLFEYSKTLMRRVKFIGTTLRLTFYTWDLVIIFQRKRFFAINFFKN